MSTQFPTPQECHHSYPFPIPCLPDDFHLTQQKNQDCKEEIEPTVMKEKLDLDMLYYSPFLSAAISKELFIYLGKELPFYRVDYKTNRAGVETEVLTPRFTTVFGVDESSFFTDDGRLLDRGPQLPVPQDRCRTCIPRPIQQCLDAMRQYVERRTGGRFNFVLISYHSVDERFLGNNPIIASLSLGPRRDFLMKPKFDMNNSLKLSLSSGDMLLIRSTTQAKWLHSIPKRSGPSNSAASWAGTGRINTTFRKAIVREGTENYHWWPVFEWDDEAGKMIRA
ncbi:hypothetical protein L873DRAFT_1825851 [Choiromyces venosus 120613-1]|uniref:Alpha-ketoglutarate-dependent dioxygenase AlkB-like domain-containing protein n=1 Tax=Choiromyces venosus 120613-1 TaxID=1336337 RepID=A0A3N4JZY0_9PEZI|nr:hypothetical protein L873DRAFT_1825851 [Choiromyces venosus 120613-1]